jgi:hypothetical protein
MTTAKRDRLAQQAKRRQAEEIAKQLDRAAREDVPQAKVYKPGEREEATG